MRRLPSGLNSIRRSSRTRNVGSRSWLASVVIVSHAASFALPTHFDIVINTDVLTPEKAAAVIAVAAT